MFRPRRLIWLVVVVGIGYSIWRWRQGQASNLSVPAATPPTPPTPSASQATPALGEAAPAGPRRIITRVHRGAPPAATPPALRGVAPEEPPPPPSEPPATHEQSLAPLTPEEVVGSHAEPEPPATHEQSLAPLAPEEAAATEEVLGAAVEAAPAGLLNLNTADLQSLIDLPGIGPALAARIIAHREQHGPFASVEDLIDIPGIGPNSLNEFRDLITV